MISKQFLYYSTKEEFLIDSGYNTNPDQEPNLDTYGQIYGSSIAYIADSKEIWTHGVFYNCSISATEVENLVNAGKIEPATLVPLVAGTASTGTSTKYAREDHIHPVQTTITGNAGTSTKLSSSRTFVLTGDITGSTSTDLSTGVSIATTLSNIDASKITTGTIDIDRLPAGALERMFVCDTEALALTVDAQEGDVVQVVGNNNKMYFCISSTATTFETKFKEFTAGTATSVPWSGITDKPNVFTPASHTQATSTITSLTGYIKGEVAAIEATDTLNIALGKLEANVDNSIKYNTVQNLSNIQKAQALNNIGFDVEVISFNDIGLPPGPESSDEYGVLIDDDELYNRLINAHYIMNSDTGDIYQSHGKTYMGYYDPNEALPQSLESTEPPISEPGRVDMYETRFRKFYNNNTISTWYNGIYEEIVVYNTNADVKFINRAISDIENTNYVSYVDTQYFSSTDKERARNNIGAISEEWVTSQGYLTELPVATTTTLGGIKFASSSYNWNYICSYGNGLAGIDLSKSIATASLQGTIKLGYTENGQNYAVRLDSNNRAYVTVPSTAELQPLHINGWTYDGTEEVTVSIKIPTIPEVNLKHKTISTIDSSVKIEPGYLYYYTGTTTATIVNENVSKESNSILFSKDKPNAAILSNVPLKFSIYNYSMKMIGLDNLSGTYYIYCLCYMPNGRLCINGAAYEKGTSYDSWS